MFAISNEVTRLDGMRAETLLCQCQETKRIMYLQDFQARCATELFFISPVKACEYLDKHYAPSIHLIASDDIYSQSPEGEMELCYFGTLIEE